MSKYVIELGEDAKAIQSISITSLGNIYVDSWYVESLEELNSDYINEHFGDLQDTAYHRGLEEGNDIGYKVGVKDGQNEAWECAKKLFSTMSETEIEKVFPTEWNNGGFNALISLQPQEAIAKLKAYEEKQADKIKVGDEVVYEGHRYVVFTTETEERYASLFDVNGNHASVSQSQCKKTGRHFDIKSILEAMKA